MITTTAKERCRTLSFWEKYSTEATKEAFNIFEYIKAKGKER